MSFALPLFTMANNIRVILNSYNPTTKQLKISLAWDNSWHDGSGQFRDAAWLFVKYKDITNSEWQHAILTTPTTANGTLTDSLNSPGVKFEVIGKNPSVAPNPVGSRGYMIRRQKGATAPVQNNPEYAGVYNVGMSMTITLVLPTGVTLANPEFRVYALEMVDIPAGSFWVGDGGPNADVRASSGTLPFQVTSETASLSLMVSGYAQTIPSAYPKGVTEYYMMKYELSNEAYCEFMNTLNRTQQNAIPIAGGFDTQSSGVWTSYSTMSKFRASFSSVSAPAIFGCDANNNGIFNEANDGQNNGAIFTYYNQILGYLDWAALRPMTGYEYEKACRGPLYPVMDEFSWGSTASTNVTMDIDPDGPNESSSSTVDGPQAYFGLRNGAFAKATGSTRPNSGGSYYGVMELSNSCHEPITGYGEADTFYQSWNGTPGDGIVNLGYTGSLQPKSGQVSDKINGYYPTNHMIITSGIYCTVRGVIK